MPLYEYQCKECGNRFEKIKKFSDVPEKICPRCGGEVEQLLSAPTLQFKGSGWYATDYAKKTSKSAAPADSAEKKSESKPETRTESKSDTSGEKK